MRFNFLKPRIRRANPDPDIELSQPSRIFINGYPSAAAFIASDPDHSLAIYNAFHKLSSRNLLYLEAEIFELQKQQDDLDIRDSRGDPTAQQCFRSWKQLSNSREPEHVERLELIEKIRKKLKEYRKSLEKIAFSICWQTSLNIDIGAEEALVLQQAILKMEKPQSGTVDALKLWLDGRSEGPYGRHAPSFSGLSAYRLDDEENLIALHPVFEKDWLARLVELPYLRLLCLVAFTAHEHEPLAYTR
jgi:hypothetical protein